MTDSIVRQLPKHLADDLERALAVERKSAFEFVGEELVAHYTGGVVVGGNKAYDVDTPSGKRIEVKTSRVASQKTTKTRRWHWKEVFGLNYHKEYDFLCLIGQKDPEFDSQYPDDMPLRVLPCPIRGSPSALFW